MTFDIGGYDPIPSPLQLDLILTFADVAGRECRIDVATLVAAFLSMDREGLIPEVEGEWDSFTPELEAKLAQPRTKGLARYSQLERVNTLMCECCGAECHAIFECNENIFKIERWSIVTTIMILVEHDVLPKLPFQWYTSLEVNYDRICETGRVIKSRTQCRAGDWKKGTHNQHPWVQTVSTTGKKRRYGLCPECDNALLLINISNPDPAQTPHGRHQLKATDGFEFSLEKILSCGLFNPSGVTEVTQDHLLFDVEACERRDFLVDNFNLAVDMFQEDTGIQVSRYLAKSVLDTYFEEHWYRWTTVSTDNLPWLFMRTAVAYNLYGKKLNPKSEVAIAILKAFPCAMLDKHNRIIAKPGFRLELQFGFRNHVTMHGQHGATRESIDFFVVRSDVGADARDRVIFEKTINLRPDEFLKRVEHKHEPTGYGQELVQIARASLEGYLARNPDASISNAEGQLNG